MFQMAGVAQDDRSATKSRVARMHASGYVTLSRTG